MSHCSGAEHKLVKMLWISFLSSDNILQCSFSEPGISETQSSLRFAVFIPVDVPEKQAVLDCDKRPLQSSIVKFPGNRWLKDTVSKCGNWDVRHVFPFTTYFAFFALSSRICWVFRYRFL